MQLWEGVESDVNYIEVLNYMQWAAGWLYVTQMYHRNYIRFEGFSGEVPSQIASRVGPTSTEDRH